MDHLHFKISIFSFLHTYFKLSVLLLVLIHKTCSAADTCDYPEGHTMCKFSGQGLACGADVPARGTENHIDVIVSEHNKLRARVANGQETLGVDGPQPAAANMLAMKWDAELAKIAQMLADQCVFNHDCYECRKVDSFANVGQNLYMSSSTQKNTDIDWSGAVKNWYSEVAKFNKNQINPFKIEKGITIGHYSQVAWASSGAVGCGVTMFQEDDGWWAKLYVCNYGPAANMEDDAMYLTGDACSKCPAGTTCSTKFPGLCE